MVTGNTAALNRALPRILTRLNVRPHGKCLATALHEQAARWRKRGPSHRAAADLIEALGKSHTPQADAETLLESATSPAEVMAARRVLRQIKEQGRRVD